MLNEKYEVEGRRKVAEIINKKYYTKCFSLFGVEIKRYLEGEEHEKFSHRKVREEAIGSRIQIRRTPNCT